MIEAAFEKNVLWVLSLILTAYFSRKSIKWWVYFLWTMILFVIVPKIGKFWWHTDIIILTIFNTKMGPCHLLVHVFDICLLLYFYFEEGYGIILICLHLIYQNEIVLKVNLRLFHCWCFTSKWQYGEKITTKVKLNGIRIASGHKSINKHVILYSEEIVKSHKSIGE